MKVNTPYAVVVKNAMGTAQTRFNKWSNACYKIRYEPIELNVMGLLSVMQVENIVYDAAKANAVIL